MDCGAAVVWDKYFCFPQVACGGQREGDGGGGSEMFGWIGGTRRNCACVVLGQLGNWMRRWFIVKM